jgi:hypothetical protein
VGGGCHSESAYALVSHGTPAARALRSVFRLAGRLPETLMVESRTLHGHTVLRRFSCCVSGAVHMWAPGSRGKPGCPHLWSGRVGDGCWSSGGQTGFSAPPGLSTCELHPRLLTRYSRRRFRRGWGRPRGSVAAHPTLSRCPGSGGGSGGPNHRAPATTVVCRSAICRMGVSGSIGPSRVEVARPSDCKFSVGPAMASGVLVVTTLLGHPARHRPATRTGRRSPPRPTAAVFTELGPEPFNSK